jgi:dTDP-4-dehydrorhamnose 3,5-epimerase
MKLIKKPFAGVLVLEPKIYIDNRGFFLESFQKKRYKKYGIFEDFVQENHSRSKKNSLRGLHFTKNKKQSQIVTVLRGRIFDVVVDIRKNSQNYGKWFGIELSDNGPRQIYMTHGFAHGFCVLSEYADLHYMVSQYHDPKDESGIIWNDPSIAIKWPIKKPNISKKDLKNLFLYNI